MKIFVWDTEKNEKLKKERDVSFEDVLVAIQSGKLLDSLSHPNKEKYSGQMILVVKIFDYVYLVPCVEDEEKIFLKTIIPSRKATKHYRIEKKKGGNV
ncbi:BrnT family toxin [Patescibacteria group bacterium]|nr:BrnT family toxin [Patescibacteria group bacterium]